MEKIVFEFTTKYGIYRDALYLPADHTYTTAEINTMKKERVQNWLAIVEAPAEEPASNG
ncbi:hypothetical protein UFOVP735_26 [uncultured Caudovirales phage]|uniref:Uncharacterized protein n=1 Tax=uncultured Caudovirales phage TaxID=2100421 RepID=A0A6J7X435_9CAUD|nr:hypothetical protein UFOVP735_26 [uncultured Caudovirales phage]